ncbi:MAG: hypothetical protein LBT44_04440, partial [Clostridiales bacterium]|nr:hypothetical protein [Clostridiales bacterium]
MTGVLKKKCSKGTAAILLAVMILTAAPFSPAALGDEATMAYWVAASIPSGATSILALAGERAEGAILQAIKDGAAQKLTYASKGVNWTGLNGKSGKAWWLVQLSSAGFENIRVEQWMRSSDTGPRDFRLEYSVDGSSWGSALGGGSVAVLCNSFASSQNDLPTEANNQQTLYIRWLMISEAQAGNGTAPVNSSGTNQIDKIRVTGTKIITAEPTPTPSDSPTPTPSNSPTPTPSDSPTPTPSDSPTPTPSDSPTPTPSDSPTPTPSDSPTPTPSD